MAAAGGSNHSAGRLAAENLDLNLRLVETRERMAAICTDRICTLMDGAQSGKTVRRRIDPLEDQRNRRLLGEHLDVCRAIASSHPWWVIEAAARIFGRGLEVSAPAITKSDIETISDPAEIRRHLDETAEYLARVLNSRRWRWLQGVRDVFGRRW